MSTEDINNIMINTNSAGTILKARFSAIFVYLCTKVFSGCIDIELERWRKKRISAGEEILLALITASDNSHNVDRGPDYHHDQHPGSTNNLEDRCFGDGRLPLLEGCPGRYGSRDESFQMICTQFVPRLPSLSRPDDLQLDNLANLANSTSAAAISQRMTADISTILMNGGGPAQRILQSGFEGKRV